MPTSGSQRDRQPTLRSRLREAFGIDIRSLAVFRIALGLILLVDLTYRAGELQAHYSDDGVLPRSAVGLLDNRTGWPIRWCMPHFLSGAAWHQTSLFVASAVFAALLTVGYRTRMATFACWLLVFSLQARNPLLMHGGDGLLRLLLFWSLFLPLGGCWSLDALGKPQPGVSVFSAGSVALLLQVCFMYWFCVAWKSDPVWHREGTAIYYALNIDQMVTRLGSALLQFPDLLRLLTFATLALEGIGPLLALFATGPVRLGVIAAFLIFHLLGLQLCMELGTFPWICAAAWLPWLPAWFWDKLGRSLQRTPSVAVANPTRKRGPSLAHASGWCRSAVGVLLLYVLLWNVRTLPRARMEWLLPTPLMTPGYALGLDQKWRMFAPFPVKSDGWYVMPGRLQNGCTVDLFRDGAAVTWEKPERVAAMYRNLRWRKFLMNLARREFAPYRPYYAVYLHAQWNSQHADTARLSRLDIVYMLETTLPDGAVSTPRPITLFTQSWRH